MVLEIEYASMDDVPDGYADLYEEKGGKAVFNGIKGIRTQADVTKLERSLAAEREETQKWKDRFSPWSEMDHDDVTEQLASIPELRKIAESKGVDEDQIANMVRDRVERETAKEQRKREKAEAERDEALGQVEQFKAAEVRRSIIADVTAAAQSKAIGLRAEAIEDACELGLRLFERTEDGDTVTRDGVGVTPGLTPEDWLDELREKKPHWWPESVGAGARGSGRGGGLDAKGACFSHEGWDVTAQGRLVRDVGEAKAKEIAARYGTTLGGKRPEPKG